MTLYVSDLDGTLLQPDATLSARARGGLRALLAAGMPFTVASARSLTSMKQLLGDLPIALPVVAHNGAVIGDLATGQAHRVLSLEAHLAAEVFDAVRSLGLHPMLTTFSGGLEHVFAQPEENGGQAAYLQGRRATGDERLREVADVVVGLAEPVISFTVIGPRGPLVDLHAALAGHPSLHTHLFDDLYAPGWTWVTVQSGAASKAAGLRELRASVGRAHEPLVVFGDQVNDLSMFDLADHAVAVANAAPPLLAIADEVIGANAEDAVVAWLEARRP